MALLPVLSAAVARCQTFAGPVGAVGGACHVAAAGGDVGFDAIIIMPDLTVQLPPSWEAILAFANEHQIPITSNTLSQVEQGALFAYLSDNIETGQQAAPLAVKILRGSNPAEIPVASAEPHLVINFNAAQELGLNLEQGILAQASQIIR